MKEGNKIHNLYNILSIMMTVQLKKLPDTERKRKGWLGIKRKSIETPGVGDGPGGLACCSPRGPREPDTTELLTELTQLGSDSQFSFLLENSSVLSRFCLYLNFLKFPLHMHSSEVTWRFGSSFYIDLGDFSYLSRISPLIV